MAFFSLFLLDEANSLGITAVHKNAVSQFENDSALAQWCFYSCDTQSFSVFDDCLWQLKIALFISKVDTEHKS